MIFITPPYFKFYHIAFFVVCDNSGKREILDIRKHGINAVPCDKKSGIVADLRRIKQFEICFHEDSKNLWKEQELYQYQKINEVINDMPKDKDNHIMDAFRYGAIALINTSRRATSG